MEEGAMTRRHTRRQAAPPGEGEEMDSSSAEEQQSQQSSSAPASDCAGISDAGTATAASPPALTVQKENIENERADFYPPTPSIPSTPVHVKRELTPKSKEGSTGTATTSRTASSLFSPPPSSAIKRQGSGSVKKSSPSSFKNWQQQQHRSGQPESGRAGQQDSSYATSYGMQQTDPRSDSISDPTRSDERRMMELGRGPPGYRYSAEQAPRDLTASYGSLSADLDIVAREGDDDFGPTVADCLNLGSFAEESPPRHGTQSRSRQRGSPKETQQQQQQQQPMQQPYPQPGYNMYRPSPPPPPQQQQQHPAYGAYYPPAGSPYGGYPPGSYPYNYGPPPQPFPEMSQEGEQQQQPPWTSPQARQFDYPDTKFPAAEQQGNNHPMSSPPPKKRRNWDHGSGSSSPDGDFKKEATAIQSPFRSPPEKSASKKFKRSPLFQGGTPGIAAYGSWDTPGGMLGGALGDEFSPMGPSFAPFGDESPLREGVTESALPFEPKLSLPGSTSEQDVARPVIRQRPAGQPQSSPFSSFVGELSPFPARMRGTPTQHDPRDYGTRHPGYHRLPEEYPPRNHPGMPPQSASKLRSRRDHRKAHMMMTSPVMSGQGAQRQRPWYEHVGPSPGPFRLELGETQPGKTRKGFDDINSVLRGGSGAPENPQRPSPQHGPYDSRRPRASPTGPPDMRTPIKLGGTGPASRTPAYHPSSANKQTPMGSMTPRYTPLSKGRVAATPGKTPSRGGMTPMSEQFRRNPCNCKKSKCLKLYCECFASELYCDACNCSECHNTKGFEPERQKAMKDTRAKNANAFKPRIAVKRGPGPQGSPPPVGHNMGCRCKRSECLKKYCECFQAGVMCGNKCKCVDCLNYVGSQALIDKRRKIKDHRGAEIAMQIADEAWKGKHAPRGMTPRPMRQPSPPGSHRAPPRVAMHPHQMMQPSPSPHQRGLPPHYMGPMMGHRHMGYSPMGMPPVTPGYVHGKQMMQSAGRRPDAASRSGAPHYVDPRQQSTPLLTTPRTPHTRSKFDPHSSKKKRKLSPGAKEPTFPYFGKFPEQPKTAALAIFSCLSNDDLYNAALVCKQWTQLAMDEELWQF